MIKRIVTLKTLMVFFTVAFVSSYICYAEAEEGNIVPVREVLGKQQKEERKAKLLKMIKSSLDTYPDIVEKIPKLSVLRTPGTESVYFYKTPDGKIFYISELDEKTLKGIWRKINRNLNR